MIDRSWVQVPARAAGEFSSPGSKISCWLLFRYPFHPRVTAVARKRSRSFCQKCRLQVTAKHTYVALNEVALYTGAWLNGVHRTCAETEASWCGTSHATTTERYQYTTFVNIKNTRYKRIQSLVRNYMRHIKAMNNKSNNCALMHSIDRRRYVFFIPF